MEFRGENSVEKTPQKTRKNSASSRIVLKIFKTYTNDVKGQETPEGGGIGPSPVGFLD